MRVVSVRGAITVENNTKQEIILNTKTLLENIIKKNDIKITDIISIIFSVTDDLDEAYPAVAAREIGLTYCSLLCLQEMKVKNSLRKCIRVLLLFNSELKQNQVKHIYLKDAVKLRPDLA
ncbi:chorismate mutase [Caldisalinibacter kiritimatiensis]|uniref:chorismate mutase n=1 Tax=Caldisalinibacter kiritimatiensis TaxID=1304284 RepID=R1AY86_9FIRM|nr:chorismate mutase [Caldisalinibacter kiritimatiensis]EOD01642.1 chorismate mutase [Caldisalinibacter kiritimatiensis]